MTSPPQRHLEALTARTPVKGQTVLDLGFGSGAFMQCLLDAGADAHGYEVQEHLKSAAIANGVPAERLVIGDGKSLPYDDETFDGACFIFSFHHVPRQQQADLMARLAKIVRRDGWLFVTEPLPFGPMTEALAPIEDEREVRQASQAYLASDAIPFKLEATDRYDIVRSFVSHHEFIESAVQADPERQARARTPEVRARIEQWFEDHAEDFGAEGLQISQPCICFWYRAVRQAA